jgi:hypothetical protein
MERCTICACRKYKKENRVLPLVGCQFRLETYFWCPDQQCMLHFLVCNHRLKKEQCRECQLGLIALPFIQVVEKVSTSGRRRTK